MSGTRNGKALKVHVAAFGKHPGWDDHIEEIGLDCAPLVKAKRVLYTECIGGNIDLGEWEKLDESKRLPFRHEFLWMVPEGVIVGRFWGSSDGKGRTKYPMIVCAFVENGPADWACVQVLPRLAQVEADCTATNSAELVRFTVGTCQRELEKASEAYNADPPPEEAVGDLVARLMKSPDLSADGHQGMVRVLYEMNRELVGFKRSGQTSITSKSYEPPGAHLRVPKVLKGAGESARAWVRVMEQEILAGYPVMVLQPEGQRFVDVLVGEPKVKAFFCARAGEGALGLTSDVPYTMSASDVAENAAKIESWAGGGATARKGGSSGVGQHPAKTARLKVGLLALAGVLLIAIVIALVSRKKSPVIGSVEAANDGVKAPEKSPSEPRTAEAAPAGVAPSEVPAVPTGGESDPRTSWAVSGNIQKVRDALDSLDRELKADGREPAVEDRARLTEIERRVTIVKTMPWRSSSKDQIERDVQSVNEQVAGIERNARAAAEAASARLRTQLQERARTSPVRSRILTAAWGTGVAAIETGAGRQIALQKADALAAGLKSAEQSLAGVGEPKAPEANLVDGAQWGKAVLARREKAERDVAEAAIAGDTSRANKVVSDLTDWGTQATALAAQAQQMQGLLTSGKLFATDANPTARELEAAIQSNRAYADLGPALGPLMSQVEAVRSVASLTGTEALIAAIKGATEPARIPGAVAAWSRLGELGWPRLPADAVEASKLASGDMRRVLDAVPDASQRDALRAQASSTALAMWSRFATANAINQAGADAALASMDGLGVTDAQIATLPDWCRYNLLLRRFQAAVGDGSGAAPISAGGRDAVRRFVADVEALGATTQQRPEVDALLKNVRPLMDPGAGLQLSNLGPGTLGWTASPPDADGMVTYTSAKPGSVVSMSFRRVPTSGDGVSFMSTTEVSVGQFIEVVRQLGKWDDIKPLLYTYGTAGDARRGPHVWEWSASSAEVMRVSRPAANDYGRGWLRPRPQMAGKEYYAAGLAVAPPAPDTPMQYVSPTAAVVFARLMGCRLPSSAEWKAAAATAPAEGANLRDATWLKQYQAVKTLLETDKELKEPPDYPAAGIFWPTGVTKKQPPADDAPAVEADDGFLWFAAVGSGAKFQHLRGNVAEFVWEDPASMDTLEPLPVKVKPYLGTGERLKVIGGSALSPKEVPIEEPVAVNVAAAREGYADVGFRLAFSAPRGVGAVATAEPIDKVVGAAAYLTPDKH